jgi:hypothetical protein
MIKYHKTTNNNLIAELSDKKFIIAEVQDILDLFGNLGTIDCNNIMIRESNLHDNFFNLNTRLAGEILQKFSNYKMRLAIIGDFSKYKSKALHDFIRESNKGNLVFFVNTIEAAVNKLSNY